MSNGEIYSEKGFLELFQKLDDSITEIMGVFGKMVRRAAANSENWTKFDVPSFHASVMIPLAHRYMQKELSLPESVARLVCLNFLFTYLMNVYLYSLHGDRANQLKKQLDEQLLQCIELAGRAGVWVYSTAAIRLQFPDEIESGEAGLITKAEEEFHRIMGRLKDDVNDEIPRELAEEEEELEE